MLERIKRNLQKRGYQVDCIDNSEVDFFIYKSTDVHMSADNTTKVKNGIYYNISTKRISIQGTLKACNVVKMITDIQDSMIDNPYQITTKLCPSCGGTMVVNKKNKLEEFCKECGFSPSELQTEEEKKSYYNQVI